MSVSSIRHGGTKKKLSSDVYTDNAQFAAMNGWFRDADVMKLADGSQTITLYKLDGNYDRSPHSVSQRLRVYDETVSAAMVTLVHLYRNSVGGLIDQEARRLLAAEFNDTENTRWKWMFSPSGAIVGDTAASLNFANTAGGVSQDLTAAITGEPGSSKYLLLKQVPATDTDNACAVYTLADKEESQTAYPVYTGMTATQNADGRITTSYNTDPTLPIQFGTKLQPSTSAPSAAVLGMAPVSYKRVCHYKLVAGTPINPPTQQSGPVFSSQIRTDAYTSVSAPIAADVFNPYPTRMLGCAGVYDGVGRPGSAWFARARFKAFMETVNKKRRIDVAEAEYDMSDVNGYIADDLNRRETIAMAYAPHELRNDAEEVVMLAATALVGEATLDWYVERDPLADMTFADRMRLVLPPLKIGKTERSTDFICHTYTDDAETWSKLFPGVTPPPNPGHDAKTRHVHYARLAVRAPRRSKIPQDGFIPQRPFERRVYIRDNARVTASNIHEVERRGVVLPAADKKYVGCGFSEAVVEPMATGMAHAVDGLTMGITDISKMFRNPELDFATSVKDTFGAYATDWYTQNNMFTLVPADPSAVSLEHVHVDSSLFVVGTTPAAFACASKMALAYIDANMGVCVPEDDEKRKDDQYARDMAALATHCMYDNEACTDECEDLAKLLTLVIAAMKDGTLDIKKPDLKKDSAGGEKPTDDPGEDGTLAPAAPAESPWWWQLLKRKVVEEVLNNPGRVAAVAAMGTASVACWLLGPGCVLSAATALHRNQAVVRSAMALASVKGTMQGTSDTMVAAGETWPTPAQRESALTQDLGAIEGHISTLTGQLDDIQTDYTTAVNAAGITTAQKRRWKKWHADAQKSIMAVRQKYIAKQEEIQRQIGAQSVGSLVGQTVPTTFAQAIGWDAGTNAANAFRDTIAAYQRGGYISQGINDTNSHWVPNRNAYVPAQPP